MLSNAENASNDVTNEKKVVDPQSVDAEIELLSMLIRDNNTFDQIFFLRNYHFYNKLHGEIFDVITKLIEKQKIADIITIDIHLQQNQMFIDYGGRDYLKKISNVITLSTANQRGELIYSLYKKRELINIGKSIVTDSYSDRIASVYEIISNAESKLYSIASTNDNAKEFQHIGKSVGDVLKKFNEVRKEEKPVTGIATGFMDVDRLLGGLKTSDLIILAARPSMGKTALAVNMAYHIARNGYIGNTNGGVVGFFSLEMSSEQIATRIISMHSGYNSRTFTTGRHHDGDKDDSGKPLGHKRVSDSEFEEMRKIISELQDIPLFIDDTPAINIATLHSRARRLKRKHDLRVIFVDYLQLVHGYSYTINAGNRVQEIAEVTQGLKAIAKDLDVSVVALSQLSRAVEGRDDKHPQLSDLRESGAIEQDADIVAFLYRGAYYLERAKPHDPGPMQTTGNLEELKRWESEVSKFKSWEAQYTAIQNLAELGIAKNRNGPIGIINLSFDASKTKFFDRAEQNYGNTNNSSNSRLNSMSDVFMMKSVSKNFK